MKRIYSQQKKYVHVPLSIWLGAYNYTLLPSRSNVGRMIMVELSKKEQKKCVLLFKILLPLLLPLL